jgi:O-antigen ligase
VKRYRSISRLLLILLTFSLVITSVITWDVDGKLSHRQYSIRHYNYPSIVLECSFVLLALVAGLRPYELLKTLQRWEVYALGTVALVAVLSANSVGLYETDAWVATTIWAAHFLFAGSILFFARQSHHLMGHWIWWALVAGALTYVSLVIAFALMMPHPESFPWALRMPGVTNVRHTGYFLAPALGVLIALYMGEQSASRKTSSLAMLAILTCFACWTGSRGVFISLLAALSLAWATFSEFRRARSWVAIVAVMAVATIVSAALPSPDPAFGILSRVYEAGGPATEDLSSGRIDVWKKTILAIEERPWIGHAAGEYRNVMASRTGQPLNHPHNIFLQILFQWGVIGAVGFFYLISVAWVRSLRHARRVGIEAGPALIVFNSLIAFSFIDGTGNYPAPISLTLIAAGFIFSIENAIAQNRSYLSQSTASASRLSPREAGHT